jgi:hypothetical protein
MASLGEELALRINATQRTLEADGVAPLEGTAQSIRRKRAIRQGTTAGVAAAAVVAIAGTGTAAVRRALDAQPAAYDLPPGGGIVHIPVDGPNPTVPDIGIACGDPAPQTVLEADGFRMELKLREDDPNYAEWGYLTGSTNIHNENTEEFPAFVMQPTLVFVKEGAVVGLVPSAGLVNRLFFTPGRDELPGDFTTSEWVTCRTGEYDPVYEEGDFHDLEAGDYEVYAVTTVANSPEIAALSRISLTYGMAPSFNRDEWLEPNDWECEHQIGWGIGTAGGGGQVGSFAAACAPAQDVRAQWDAESRSLVLPYSDGIVSRVFTTHLVAEPFTYTVRAAQPEIDTGSPIWSEPPAEAEVKCGADLGWSETSSRAELYSSEITLPRLREDPRIEAIAWLPFGPGGVDARVATVTPPERARAFITYQGSVYNEELDSWVATNTVAGYAWVTVNGGNPINVSRALGPAATSVEFEDIEWCPALPDIGELSATVVGELNLRGGSVAESSRVFTIHPGHIE